ncbi:Aldo/keto reductase family protein [Amycolatopsis pretoriensis]|uniref:Aldo/keto reductase family protein n=1 Tax=Amycolatopsis pretoriensis TaxID=218821 RepID=A0A1H5RIC1_9PSEU|nr:aldo/keto reductase [Amycolatopsis pretoriensis]SEF38102.1 Aldo/keto reductase family protein [Amycolatopsis pretoriensis]
MAGFEDLSRSGKIRYGGLPNLPTWRVPGAAVRLKACGRLAGIQTEYCLAKRSGERELLPMAEAHGHGVVLYSPLAGGLLTGKYRRGEPGRLATRSTEADGTAVLDAVLAVAEKPGRVRFGLPWRGCVGGRHGPGRR